MRVPVLQALIAFITLAGPASAAMPALHATGACTDSEKWHYGSRITPYWSSKLEQPFDDDKSGISTLILASALKDSTKSADVKALADYWVARSFLQAKLPRVAALRFTALVMQDTLPETSGVREAALDCVGHILAEHPALEIPDGFLASAARLPDKRALWSIAFRLAMREGGSAEATAILNGSGPYESLLNAYSAAARRDDAGVERWAMAFLSSHQIPDDLARYHDPVEVLLGRAQFGLKKYAAALRSFKKVSNTSNAFAAAVNGQAWSDLDLGRMADAVGEAQNSIVGGLSSVFDPEANLIVAIALNETCNYPEAMDSLRHFKRSYARTYRWLMTWDKPETTSPALTLYERLTHGLKQPGYMPDRVLTEWLRSPTFLADQDELNLLLDEKAAQVDLPAKLDQAIAGKKNWRWRQAKTRAQGLLEVAGDSIRPRTAQLTAAIDRDLAVRTRRMKVSLYEVLSNLRLLEAEVYNAMSEKMVADYANPDAARKAKERAAARAKAETHSGGSVWDWGRFPASDNGKTEIWEDELGFLKADLTSKCH